MRGTFRIAAGIALLVWTAACRDAAVGGPTGVVPDTTMLDRPVVPPAALVWVGFGPKPPTFTGPYRVFNFAAPAGHPVGRFTQKSRYVLYDDGAFFLEFFEYWSPSRFYSGVYQENEGTINFDWRGRVGDWAATGVEANGRLTVKYNWEMGMIDFEDAVYVQR